MHCLPPLAPAIRFPTDRFRDGQIHKRRILIAQGGEIKLAHIRRAVEHAFHGQDKTDPKIPGCGRVKLLGEHLGGIHRDGEVCEWLNALWEWPRSRLIIEQIAARLVEQQASSQSRGPVHYFWPAVILRNFLFLVTVLLHGFRRLAPPY